MAKQEYISVEVQVYMKDFRMYVKVPTKNYKDHHDAWINGEKLVKEFMDLKENILVIKVICFLYLIT